MQLLDEYEYENTRLTARKQHLASHVRQKTQLEASIVSGKNRIAATVAEWAEYESVDDAVFDQFPPIVKKSLRAKFLYNRRHLGATRHSLERMVEQNTDKHKKLCVALTQLQLDIAKLEQQKENVISVAAVNQALESNPNITNFKLFHPAGYVDEKPWLSFIAYGLEMTVLGNSLKFLNQGDKVVLPVAPTLVVISNRGDVFLFPVAHLDSIRQNHSRWTEGSEPPARKKQDCFNNLRTLCDTSFDSILENAPPPQEYYASHPTTHPHVMTGYNACLGDFGPPLREAIEEGDVFTMLSVACLFLMQIDPYDSAGSRYLRHKIGPNEFLQTHMDREYLSIKTRNAEGEVCDEIRVAQYINIDNHGNVTRGPFFWDSARKPQTLDELLKRIPEGRTLEVVAFCESYGDGAYALAEKLNLPYYKVRGSRKKFPVGNAAEPDSTVQSPIISVEWATS